MRLLPSDPDIQTIVTRIESGDLDLQPTFQRGEVWTKVKRQKLIDSVLRNWHIPPIHVIEASESGKQEVLDGQQRLVSIRDFCRNDITVDGAIEPRDAAVMALDGLKYRELPDEVKRRFNQFTIRVFRIVDFQPAEAGELFFRLNQPTSLTGAEQRNAFVGPVRQQVKDLVAEFARCGLDETTLGFSNARMAYEDVMARVALSVRRGGLGQKIVAADLVDFYRSETALSAAEVNLITEATTNFGNAVSHSAQHLRFNKATLFSWLMFAVRALKQPDGALAPSVFGRFLDWTYGFLKVKGGGGVRHSGSPEIAWLVTIFDQRSTARVADVASVLLRDAALWLLFGHYLADTCSGAPESIERLIAPLRQAADVVRFDTDALLQVLVDSDWSEL